jgi:uncharacterized repeat protein (TIGR01451 family)
MTQSTWGARGRRAALVLLSFLLVLASGWAGAQTAQDKESLQLRMLQLQDEMAEARSRGTANQGSGHAALESELRAISASLGGDLPCAVGPATAATVLGGPPLPGGCTAVSTTANNTTPVAIPDGPGVVTSTITVSGAAPYLWELTATTFIRHTFSADLDITLQSPAGTVVTLTTDNGAGNDDVFNGTVWSDRANPGGQVPYTSNNGLVTDHAYANLTLASPLVPEEALSAFAGENPNGTWTLTISDDLAGDGGSLDQWSLNLVGFAAAPVMAAPQTFTNSTPLTVPTGPAVVTSTLAVSGLANPICGINLTTNLAHTFAADLDVTLQSPGGTVVTLTTDNGAGNDDVFAGTVWRDNANPAGQVPYTTNDGIVTDHAYVNLTAATPLVVEESLGAFRGESGNGTWTLTISDDLAGDGGSLNSWSLQFITCTCAQPADLSIALSASPATVTAGSTFNLIAVATNNGPGTASDVSITLPVPAGSTLLGSSASAGGTCSGTGPVVCTWAGATANGATRTATLNLRAPSSPGPLSASASVSATSTDPVSTNNSAALTVGVNASPPAIIPTLGMPLLLLLAALTLALGWIGLRRQG